MSWQIKSGWDGGYKVFACAGSRRSAENKTENHPSRSDRRRRACLGPAVD